MLWPSPAFFSDKGFRRLAETDKYEKVLPNGKILVFSNAGHLSLMIHENATGATNTVAVDVDESSDITHFHEIFVGYFLAAAENTLKRC